MFLDFLAALLQNDAEMEFEKQNFESEMEKIREREVDAENYARMYAENPDSEIGEISWLLSQYKQNQPYQSWDWDRLREIAEIVVPLSELIQKNDPDATINGELDALLESDLVVTVKFTQYFEWSISYEEMPEFRKIIDGTDSFSIAPLEAENLEATFVFRGVRKPVE